MSILPIRKIKWNIQIFQRKCPQNLCQPTTPDVCDIHIFVLLYTPDTQWVNLYLRNHNKCSNKINLETEDLHLLGCVLLGEWFQALWKITVLSSSQGSCSTRTIAYTTLCSHPQANHTIVYNTTFLPKLTNGLVHEDEGTIILQNTQSDSFNSSVTILNIWILCHTAVITCHLTSWDCSGLDRMASLWHNKWWVLSAKNQLLVLLQLWQHYMTPKYCFLAHGHERNLTSLTTQCRCGTLRDLPLKYDILACLSEVSLCCTTPIPTWLTLSKSLHCICCKLLDHPPYSVGLSPCDFDISSSLMKMLTATGSGQTQTSIPQRFWHQCRNLCIGNPSGIHF